VITNKKFLCKKMSHVYVVINRPATYEDFAEESDQITGENTRFTIISVCKDLFKAREAFRSSEPEQGELIVLYELPFNETEFRYQLVLDKKTRTERKSF